MMIKIKGTYKDPYTWEAVRFEKTINIDSCEAARRWIAQTYGRAYITYCEKVNE